LAASAAATDGSDLLDHLVEFQVVQVPVEGVVPEQLLVVAHGGEAALVQQEQAVAAADGRDAVRQEDGRPPRQEARQRVVQQLGPTGELALLLVSAFRRLLLCEDAYGFTTARLYGQVYMVWLAVVLSLVALELRRGLDGHRVVRRAGVAAALTLTGLIYWNHEAWIVQRNVARFAATRQFDARYAVWSLSLNAVPALIAALDKLPPDAAGPLRLELVKRYGTASPENLRWYEWNLRRAWAQRALSGIHGSWESEKTR